MTNSDFRVLIAPDSFKGTFSAAEVAKAISAGVLAAGGEADLCPLADGGEGTMRTLLSSAGGTIRTVTVQDPLGRGINAGFGLIDEGATAIVEMAEASGMGLVEPEERDAEAASTFGTGELLVAAARTGAGRILVAVGGSATTDGGAGCLEAVREAGGIGDVELVVLCDVAVPWEMAPPMFAPQKGADSAAVARLEDRLSRLAQELPKDPTGIPRTGAAGGLAGGLWAGLGADLVSGADWMLDAAGFDERAQAADIVVTGEGRLDRQSTEGKLVGAVLQRTDKVGVATIAAVGQNDLDERAFKEMGLAAVVEAETLDELRNFGESLRPPGWCGT